MAVDLNYGVGVEGKNLVLKTLGRVYVKVKDRKYELLFRPEEIKEQLAQYQNNTNADLDFSGLIVVNSITELNQLDYPGDNTLIVTKDGSFYVAENRGYNKIPLSFEVQSLTLNQLTMTGPITFTENDAPFILNNSVLIPKLNADLLDGYHSSDFAIKNDAERITNNWTFTNAITAPSILGLQQLTSANGFLNINFETGVITCKEIYADNLPEEEEINYNLISGIGGEVWVGNEVEIIQQTNVSAPTEINKLALIELLYEEDYLPTSLGDTEVDINFWYSIFFNSYDFETGTYDLKNFHDQSIINSINAQLEPYYSINDFWNLIYALENCDLSTFVGDYQDLSLPDGCPTELLLPNMIIKDDHNNVGVIVDRTLTIATVRNLKTDGEFWGKKVIVIGNAANAGGIVFKATNPSISILRNVLDESSNAIYFGELSKIDNTKSGIGMLLNGSVPDNKVADNQLDSLRNYTHTSEINIENPYIKWQQINELNEDGSGYLSKGQIRWSSNNDLVVDDSDIINSRINNSGITDSSFEAGNVLINTNGSGNIGTYIEFNATDVTKNIPMGSAGGDLTGNYPNPTIADGKITTAKIADGAVTSNKIADNSITSNKIVNGTIQSADLANNIITSDKIADGAVSTSDLANSAITTDKIANKSVNRDKLTDELWELIEQAADTSELENAINDLKYQVSELETDVTTNATNISTNASNISSLSSQVNTLNASVSTNTSNISSLSTNLSSLSATVSGHTTSINNLSSQLSNLTSSVNEDYTNLEARVTALETTVGTLNTRLENRLNGN